MSDNDSPETSPFYIMILFVAGEATNSRLARENLNDICREYIDGRCRIKEIDVLKDYAAALADKIYVTPALVLESPEPRVVVIGNLADRERVMTALRLPLYRAK